jgi:CRP/FNR family transcriptional regulator
LARVVARFRAAPRAADTLTAITEAVVAFVPFGRLGAIYTGLPRLAALFAVPIQAERLALMDVLAVTGRAPAKQQLVRLLLELHARLTPLGPVEDDGFELPLSQEVIGDSVGLTVVHVNRKPREMRESGPIGYEGTRVRIPNMTRLRGSSPVGPRQLQVEPPWLPPASLSTS